MIELTQSQWLYLNGPPLINGQIKVQLEDFKVDEQLSFEPSGQGEHTLLKIQKTGLNTAYVGEKLAAHANLPLKAISYAGRKDKYAKTTQWFGVYYGHKANQPKADWSSFTLEGTEIVEQVQNDKKLKVGAISQNLFEIIIRCNESISTEQETLIKERVEKIKLNGVPNYYGNQRFGELIKPDGTKHVGGNLAMAERLLNGEEIRNRNKRSMAISALRSWLFNQLISDRLQKYGSKQWLRGDAIELSGSNSFFIFDDDNERSKLEKRLASQDVMLTAPLWGKGDLQSQADARKFEESQVKNYEEVCQTLERLDISQQRRSLLLHPQHFGYKVIDNNIILNFGLPSGCFATSVIRELVNT